MGTFSSPLCSISFLLAMATLTLKFSAAWDYSTMLEGGTLAAGQFLQSPKVQYMFRVDGDSCKVSLTSLVARDFAHTKPIWTSSLRRPLSPQDVGQCVLKLHANGNLVMHGGEGLSTLWESGGTISALDFLTCKLQVEDGWFGGLAEVWCGSPGGFASTGITMWSTNF